MLKKLTLLAVSAGALLAFAAPAAQAEPLITNAAGEAAQEVNGTSTNAVTTTAAGTIGCTTANFHLNITENASPQSAVTEWER